ncbi:hypothetical protein JTB14_034084 [Gonioctena quinquepunctata]|nr:hypothetical protein JTB14_034084 [Gonioctena quinquepunctata]
MVNFETIQFVKVTQRVTNDVHGRCCFIYEQLLWWNIGLVLTTPKEVRMGWLVQFAVGHGLRAAKRRDLCVFVTVVDARSVSHLHFAFFPTLFSFSTVGTHNRHDGTNSDSPHV